VGTLAKPPLLKMTALQLASLVIITLMVLPLGMVTGYSFFLGGLIQVAGSGYFARLAYRYQGASQIRRVVSTMYRAETGKIALTAALFAIAIFFVNPLNYMVFFTGYGVMVVSYAVVAARLIRNRKP
jgi:ATP synthase protein I